MNSGFNPKVLNPNLNTNSIPQTLSGGFQKPFFFGGSQVPYDLNLKLNLPNKMTGKGMCGSGVCKVNKKAILSNKKMNLYLPFKK